MFALLIELRLVSSCRLGLVYVLIDVCPANGMFLVLALLYLFECLNE